jgi:hypothetical protein
LVKGLADPVEVDWIAVDPKRRRTDRVEIRPQHRRNLVSPFEGFDVPGERNEVAPEALIAEKRGRARDVARIEGGVERREP